MAPDGSVETPLDEAAVLDAADRLVAAGVASLAIGFLHSYANPAHERRAAELIAARHPGLHLSLSSEVSPQIREYERISTTVANAYVKPLADSYLDRLARRDRGARHRGAALPDALQRRADARRGGEARPRAAAGVRPGGGGARRRAVRRALRRADLLAFDMGGTTAKLADGARTARR